MAQRAQLVLDFIPQLSAEKLNVIIAQLKKSLGSLGNDIELIDVDAFETQLREVQVALDRVNTDDLQREINAVVEETQKAANDINKALSNINTDELQKGLQDAANEYDKFTKEGNNDSAKKGVTELAASFAQARNEISATIGTQKQALAALALAGKSGTEEFENLAQEIKKNQTELESLKTAAESVEKALSDVPQKSGVDAITDDYKKLRSELATTIAAQKESLGALSFAGKSGTDEFAALQKQIRQNQEELNKLEEAAKEAEKSLSDIPQKSRGDALADEFTAGRNALASLVEQQKKALAGLASTGNSGSEEFQNLREEIIKNQKELKKLDDVAAEIDDELNKLSDSGKKAFDFNQVTEAFSKVAGSLNEVVNVGAQFETTLKAVQAVTGGTNEQMADLGSRARELSKEFGGAASDQLKSFQGVLSKFGAQVAEQPAALGAMAKSINILSVAGGIDAQQSMSALTDTMLQFGLVTGDAEKDAATMAKTADALAASAQVGAAEIPQVAESILQVGVAAKGAKLSMEQTTAAIQVLAVGGKTGAEAGVALRNVLGLLQNASGPAEEAMKKLGTSSKELGQILTTQGLDAAIGKLKGGIDGLSTAAEQNVALMEIFGSENASAAGILLDNVDKFKEFQTGIQDAVAQGADSAASATAQAAVQMNTAEKLASRAKANLEDLYIGLFDTIGSGTAGAISAFAQLGPQIQNLAGIKQILPESAITGLSDSLGKAKGLLLNTLGGDDLLKKVDGLKGKFAELGPALSNPVTIGVGVGVAALTYFFTQTDEGRKQFAQLEESAKAFFAKLEPVFDGAGKVFGTFVGTVIQLGEAFISYLVAPLEIGITVLGEIVSLFGGTETSAKGAASTIDTAASALQKIAEWLALAGKAIGNFSDGFKVGKEQLIAFIQGSEQILGAFGEFAVTALNPANWFDGDASAAKAKLSKILDETVGKAAEEAKTKLAAANLSENLTEALTLKTDLDKNKKLDELVKKFNTTKDAAEKANIAEQIQKQVPGAVKALGSVVDAQGKIIGQYDISTQKVQEYAKAQEAASGDKLKTKQAEIVKGIEAQSNAYAETIKKQKELADEIVKDTAAGKDTAALKKKYDEITKTAQEETTKLKDAIEKGADVGVQFSDAKISPAFQAEFDAKLGELREKAAKAEIGKAITEASQIKENLDKQDKIGELVKKFKGASNDVEKNYFAKKIGEQMPGVVKETIKGVDANGKLIKSYELATDQVDKQLAASTRLYSGDLRAKQVQYVDSVQKEGASYQDNLKKVESLGKEIEKKKALGVDTTKLEKDLKAAQTNVVESQKKILLMGADFEKMGLKSGAAISEIAKALNVSEKEAKRLLEAQTGLSKEAKLSAAEIGKLAESYTAAINNINTALQNGVGASAELKRQNEELGKKTVELQQELNKLKTVTTEQDVARRETVKKELADAQEQIKKNSENLKQLRADNQKAAKEKAALDAGLSRENERANERTLKGRLANFAVQQNAAEFAKTEFENDQKKLFLEQRRAETQDDQLLRAQKNLDIDREQLKKFQEKFDAQKKITSALFDSADAAKGYEEAIRFALGSYKEIGTKADAESLVQQLKTLVEKANAARENRNKLLVDVQIDPFAVQKSLLEFDKAQLEIKVDVGYITDEDANKERQQILQRELNLTIAQNDKFLKEQKAELERVNNRIADEERKGGQDLFDQIKKVREEQANERNKIESGISDIEALERVDAYVKDYEKLTELLLREDAKKGNDRNERLITQTKQQLESLRKNVDLGTSDNAVLTAYLQDAERRSKALLDIQKRINETTDIDLIDNLKKQALVIKNGIEERGRQTKLAEERTAADIVKLKRELNAKELAALQEDIAVQQKFVERQLELFERTLAAFTGSSAKLLEQSKNSANAQLDSDIEKRKKELDKLKGTVSDEALARRQEQLLKEQQKRREALEKEHQRKLANISALAEGQRLAATREADVQRLRQMERVKQKEYEFATESGDVKASERLATELININDELRAKGDILQSSVGDLQNAITEGLGNLFAGDVEAAKEPFRKLLGVLAGALSKTAAGLVTKLVLEQLALTPGGAASLLLTPVITGVVQAGINAILTPTINSLTSFASGGRVDEPTLAVVGDGAKLGESNREWIFRDQQLQTVIYQAATAGNDDVVRKLDEVVMALNGFSGRVRITEREIYEAGNKERSRVSRRAR